MYADTTFSRNTSGADPLVLVAEISHRVFNEYTQAIAGIQIAAKNVESCEARAILATAATRLLSFAEAHRALQAPRTDKTVDLGNYLAQLCDALTTSSLQERGVSLTFTAVTAPLAAERCWRVALIVSELITNSARHGLHDRPGHILVEIAHEGANISCRVTDDGCGSPHARPGRGFDVVTALAEELGGVVGWCFSAGGTAAELTFPCRLEEPMS